MIPRPPFRLTLIEVLILVVIALTLATIAVPRLIAHRQPPPAQQTNVRAPGGARTAPQ